LRGTKKSKAENLAPGAIECNFSFSKILYRFLIGRKISFLQRLNKYSKNLKKNILEKNIFKFDRKKI